MRMNKRSPQPPRNTPFARQALLTPPVHNFTEIDVSGTARDKLNIGCGAAAIGIAAVFGAITQSWLLFILVAAGLLTVFFRFGLIR